MLGGDNPRQLVFSYVYLVSKLFGWRASNEGWLTKMQDFTKVLKDGMWCWKRQETSTKTHNLPCDTTTESEIKYITQNHIDPSRCTNELFDKYMDIRKDI